MHRDHQNGNYVRFDGADRWLSVEYDPEASPPQLHGELVDKREGRSYPLDRLFSFEKDSDG